MMMMNCYQCQEPVHIDEDEHHTLVLNSVIYMIHDVCVSRILVEYITQLNNFEAHIDALSKREEIKGHA